MSSYPIIKKMDTRIQLAEFTEMKPVGYARKRTSGCSLQKAALAMILTVLVFGVGSLGYFVFQLEIHHVKDLETLRTLTANYSRTHEKLVNLEKSLEEQLSETDDPFTANQKLIRKMRSLSECHPRDKKCEYADNIAFFYTSPAALAPDFTQQQRPNMSSFRCNKQLVSPRTGQVWCVMQHPRADMFYNRFPLVHPPTDPGIISWAYLNQSAIMMKPGAGWTDLSHHEYYGLEDGTKIRIKKSGIYMLYASVNFNVQAGSAVGYGIHKNNDVLKACRLPSIIPRNRYTHQMESCFIFVVGYLNKGDDLTMKISTDTNFALGETNFYIGLYHLASVGIAVN